jgi:hypothetical protein
MINGGLLSMPFCPDCGKEVPDNAVFCPHCRAHLKGFKVNYVKPRKDWPIVKIVSVLIGVIVIIAAIGLLFGGTAVLWVQSEFSDDAGFLTMWDVRVHTNSYAVVLQDVDLNMDIDVPANFWAPNPGDFVTVKLVGASNYPSKEVFISIAMKDDALNYLREVEYDEVSHCDWDYKPGIETPPQIFYERHAGSAPSGPPTMHSFWAAHASGDGTHTLMWEPEVGSFWIVVMNSDGSAGIDLDMRLGVKVPILRTVGIGLTIGGIVTLLVGGVFIYYGALHNRSTFSYDRRAR